MMIRTLRYVGERVLLKGPFNAPFFRSFAQVFHLAHRFADKKTSVAGRPDRGELWYGKAWTEAAHLESIAEDLEDSVC